MPTGLDFFKFILFSNNSRKLPQLKKEDIILFAFNLEDEYFAFHFTDVFC